MKLSAKGFTLIELLIVIAVLGILAVAVLSAINPIEQINRSRDTGSRSDAEQLISAVDRFYASRGYYPWQTVTSAGGVTPTSPSLPLTTVNDSWVVSGSSVKVLDVLSSSGTEELKKSFVTRIHAAANPLFVYHNSGASDSFYVCFKPLSGAFKTEANTRCVDTTGKGLPEDIETSVKGTLCGSTENPYSCLP